MRGKGEGGEGVDGGGVETSVCEMDPRVQRRGRREIRLWSEEREELVVDVDAEGADGEDVAAEVEFAVLERGE